jgi:membrane-associated phospholipid phosphatase
MQLYFHVIIFIIISVTSASASVKSDFDESPGPECPDTTLIHKQEYVISPDSSYLYAKPRFLQWAKQIPSDMGRFFKISFSKKNLWKTGAVLGASAIMVAYDQQMLDGTQHFARQIGISGANNQVAPIRWSIKLGSSSLYMPVYFPANLNTGMYFLGDGFTHLSITLGFWTAGKISKDNHALQTASQLLESMVTIGIITQTLKHITGRESPYTSTTKGGKWKFFPNQAEYAKHVPNHDAFPSGHLATWVSTFTVLSENYPDRPWIRVVGYGLGTALSFAMVNNGVHWVADYPLAIAIGYVSGKIVTARGHEVKYNKKTSLLYKARPGIVLPSFSGHSAGFHAFWQF